jgi:hypothetical protein
MQSNSNQNGKLAGDHNQPAGPTTERQKMDNHEKQLILLSRITQLKDVQIYCLKEEEKLNEELSILKDIEMVKERNK